MAFCSIFFAGVSDFLLFDFFLLGSFLASYMYTIMFFFFGFFFFPFLMSNFVNNLFSPLPLHPFHPKSITPALYAHLPTYLPLKEYSADHNISYAQTY